jgi:flagellar basal body-associated protein FliL
MLAEDQKCQLQNQHKYTDKTDIHKNKKQNRQTNPNNKKWSKDCFNNSIPCDDDRVVGIIMVVVVVVVVVVVMMMMMNIISYKYVEQAGPNFRGQWIALLLHIVEVLCSNLGPETAYPV